MASHSTIRRIAAQAGFCLAALVAAVPHAQAESPLAASSTFVQAGFASDARTYVLGATRDWSWTRPLRWGSVGGYWESSIGQWRTRNAPAGDTRAFVTQFGITPVLRWHPSERNPGVFLELGIGANVLFPIYETEGKRFSTAFNFGDHLALGRRRGRHELALRVQHFSNAGIKHPNPGEDFVQLRHAIRY